MRQRPQAPGARPRWAPQDPRGPFLTDLSFLLTLTRDILCPFCLLSSPATEGLRLEPVLSLTLKASCRSSTMLDESSCSTPREDTGKYVCSFCRRECQAAG